jgi:hypothetical protein
MKRMISITLFFIAACSTDAAATLAGAPLQVRGAPEPREPTIGLCCAQDVCTLPRMGQTECAAGTENRRCAPVRLEGDIGPLWQCRETSPVTAKIVTSAKP